MPGGYDMNKVYFLIFIIMLACNPVYSEDYPPFELNKTLQFPKDHGVHHDTRYEWWYFTGHVLSKDQRKFGFELTFFRAGINLSPSKSPSAWKVNNLYSSHFAI